MDEPIDEALASRFLAERYGDDAGSVASLGAGDWSRAFSFRLDGRDRVIRFGRYVEDFLKDQKAATFARPGLPIPEVLEVGEAAPGLFYAVSERRFGVFPESLDAPGWRNLMPALLRGLDALREVEAPGVGTDWAGDATDAPVGWRQWLLASLEDHLDGRVSGWRARLSEMPDVQEVFVSGERALQKAVESCPEVRHIVHRDLLNRNVLVSADPNQDGNLRLEAVFDWGCSLAGDFLYEIAWLTFWAPWYPALEAVNITDVVKKHYAAIGLKVEDFDRRLACYELHIGLEHIAYATFTGRADDQQAVTRRTRQVLERSAPYD